MPGPFVVVGESLVDVVVPADDGDRHDAVGGSPLNVAVGLSRLDVSTTLVTRLGEDRFGSMIREHVRASAVTLSEGSVVAGGTTSTATAHLDEQHAATYDFEIDWDLPRQKLPHGAVGVHVGSLGTTLEPGRESVVDLVRQAADEALFVSYDPNIRPFFLDDVATAWRGVRELAGASWLVKVSDEDLRLLSPDADGQDEEALCRELLDGPLTELVVLTRGSGGARAFRDGATLDVTAPPTEVVDTVGAGDSFMAAMLAMLHDWAVVGGAPGAMSALDDDRVEQLVRGATVAAAVTCSRRGANPPTRRELPPAWPAG